MRVFGCAAYMFDTRPTSKLDNRSIPGIFIGYTESTRQHLVLGSDFRF